MKKRKIALKLRLSEDSVYRILFEKIESCKSKNSEVIRFPVVLSKLAAGLSIPKKRVWNLLFFLHDMGLIEMKCGHGILLNYEAQ